MRLIQEGRKRKKLIEGGSNDNNAPLFSFGEMIYKWLDNALDFGITEFDFWNMTLAEVERAIESKKRVILANQKSQAMFDYTLALLIGRSVSRIFNSKNEMPTIAAAYPSLFESEENEEEKIKKMDELSAIRFRLFAQSINKKFKDVRNEQ